MSVSVFDLFKIGIGPSSSHTVGPMIAARQFACHLQDALGLQAVHSVTVELFGSLNELNDTARSHEEFRMQLEKNFEQAMAAVPEVLGVSVRLLVRRLAALPTGGELDPAARERLPSLAAWDSHRELTQRVHRSMQERFGLHSLAQHPFARLSAALVGDDHAYGRAEQLVDACETLLAQLDPLLDDDGRLLDHDTALAPALAIAEEADLPGAQMAAFVEARARRHWVATRFYRALGRMLFDAAEPDLRYRIFERFYRLPQPLIERFYAARSTPLDKARVLCGKPPVPIGRALHALRTPGTPLEIAA